MYMYSIYMYMIVWLAYEYLNDWSSYIVLTMYVSRPLLEAGCKTYHLTFAASNRHCIYHLRIQQPGMVVVRYGRKLPSSSATTRSCVSNIFINTYCIGGGYKAQPLYEPYPAFITIYNVSR